MCLGQYQTPDKANEIPVLPDLLALLGVDGCLLTMDAIGCQKSVTQAIAGAEYLLALKGNQPVLHTAVKVAFAVTASTEVATTAGEKPARRVETRTCQVLPADCLPAALRGPEWIGLRTLVEVVTTRTAAVTGVTTTETRHYLSSCQAPATAFQDYVRRHWGIEKPLALGPGCRLWRSPQPQTRRPRRSYTRREVKREKKGLALPRGTDLA